MVAIAEFSRFEDYEKEEKNVLIEKSFLNMIQKCLCAEKYPNIEQFFSKERERAG